MVFECLAFLGKDKENYEVSACFSLKALTNFKDRSEQCCGSGSGIRDWCLFDPWIRDPE
jgi:hypothetical protein